MTNCTATPSLLRAYSEPAAAQAASTLFTAAAVATDASITATASLDMGKCTVARKYWLLFTMGKKLSLKKEVVQVVFFLYT